MPSFKGENIIINRTKPTRIIFFTYLFHSSIKTLGLVLSKFLKLGEDFFVVSLWFYLKHNLLDVPRLIHKEVPEIAQRQTPQIGLQQAEIQKWVLTQQQPLHQQGTNQKADQKSSLH